MLFGLLTILLIGWMDWRIWNGRVALLAAAGWAFLPEAVQADGHARFYTQHVFLTLLTLWLTYQALRPSGEPKGARVATWRAQLLVALAFGLALFTQEETLLLYPTLVLNSYLWRGWRYFRQPPVLVAQFLCLVFSVEEQYVLTLPAALAPGAYHLLVGWYQVTTQERLRLLDQRDTLEFARWVVR